MRRGQADYLEWFPRLIVLAVAIVVIALLVRYYSNRDIDAAQMDRAAHIYRIYYDDIIMYSDPQTKRVYSGIVDMGSMDEKRLSDVFSNSSRIGSCITTKPDPGCGIAEKTICQNKVVYDLGTSQMEETGIGAATREVATFPVTLKDGEMRCTGVLSITVVRMNS